LSLARRSLQRYPILQTESHRTGKDKAIVGFQSTTPYVAAMNCYWDRACWTRLMPVEGSMVVAETLPARVDKHNEDEPTDDRYKDGRPKCKHFNRILKLQQCRRRVLELAFSEGVENAMDVKASGVIGLGNGDLCKYNIVGQRARSGEDL